jgi:hypothetical protein
MFLGIRPLSFSAVLGVGTMQGLGKVMQPASQGTWLAIEILRVSVSSYLKQM